MKTNYHVNEDGETWLLIELLVDRFQVFRKIHEMIGLPYHIDGLTETRPLRASTGNILEMEWKWISRFAPIEVKTNYHVNEDGKTWLFIKLLVDRF